MLSVTNLTGETEALNGVQGFKMVDGEAAYIPALATGLYEPYSLIQLVHSIDPTDTNTYYYLYLSDNTKTFYDADGQELEQNIFYVTSQNDIDLLFERMENTSNYYLKEDEICTTDTTGYDDDSFEE